MKVCIAKKQKRVEAFVSVDEVDNKAREELRIKNFLSKGNKQYYAHIQ